jgi:hypothetical protein
MFGSTIIDVAVGLIFFYFLLSTITLHLNEFIASKMQWRANDLENQIRHMLGDPDLANKVLQNPMITSMASKGRKPVYIPSNIFALALFDAFVPDGQNANVFDHVRAAVASDAPSNSASRVVLNMVDRGNGDLTQARKNAEDWFNQSMDRLTEAYKSRIQALSFVVALGLTFILGADTLAIANALYMEPALRAAVTGAAQGVPVNAAAQTTSPNPAASVSSLQQSVDLLSKSSLPIGWTSLPIDTSGWVRKLVGLLLTTLAVSLGAPFWFDVLNNLANLGSSGPAFDSTKATVPAPNPPLATAPAQAAVPVSQPKAP